jgi:hypothetical protein
LREHKDAAEVGVDAIGESDVNDAIESAKGNGGLGAVARERPQAFALASCKEYSDGVAHVGHGSSLVGMSSRSGSFYVTARRSTSAERKGGKER